MKTGTARALVGALVIGAASAVTHPAQAAEITLWHAWRGQERSVLEAAAADYQSSHPNDTIELVFVPYEGLATKLEASVPRGNGPDLFIFAHEKLSDWVTSGIVRPVSRPFTNAPPPAADPLNAALTVSDAAATTTFGWPLASKCLALFYNKDLISEPPTTTDALLRIAEQLRDAPTHPTRWGFAWEATSAYQNAAWMHGFGGGLFANGNVVINSAENVAAFDYIQRLAALGPAETSGALITQLFNDGKVAMVPNGPWFLGEIEPPEKGGPRWGVTTLPVVSETARPMSPWLTVEALFLARDARSPNPGSPEQETLARDFAAYLQSPPVALRRATEAHQIVPGIAVDDAVLTTFQAQAKLAQPMPTTPEMSRTWEPLARAFRRLVRGTATPEQAAAEAQTTYLIVSRPAPETVDHRPYTVVFGALVLAATMYGVRRLVEVRAWQSWRDYLWIAPGGLAVAALVVAPFLVGASVSLFEVSGSATNGSWRFIGAQHFLDILLSRDFPLSSPSTRALSFWFTLAVTIVWTLANVVLHVSLGVFLAMMLREPWVRMRSTFRALLIVPWAVPNYITALAWKGMFHQQFGAINALLGLFGLAPVSWFAHWSTAFAANVATNTWLGFPFMMVVTLGALQSIPRELEEAAEMDGATGWQRFRLVTLPLLKPALLPAVVLGSVWTFNMFNVIYLVSGGEPDGSTDILVSQAYRWAFTRGHRYGYGAAYAVIIFGVMLVQSRVLNRLAGRKVV